MNELMGVPTDADFFDWAADVESRFFLAPELGIVSGFALRAPQRAIAGPAPTLALTYRPELPRSAS